MNINNLPIGSIIISSNTRLIIVGYNKGNDGGYIVCPCNESSVDTKKLYILFSNQIEKLLSLGYVDYLVNNITKTDPFNNNVVPTSVSNLNKQTSGKYKFDENGFVIG